MTMTSLAGDGCADLAIPHCLDCPLPFCRFDSGKSKQVLGMLNERRVAVALARTGGDTIAAAALTGLARRTVFRHKRRLQAATTTRELAR